MPNVTRTEVPGGEIILTVYAETPEQFEPAKVAIMEAIDAQDGYRLILARALKHGDGRTFQVRMEREVW